MICFVLVGVREERETRKEKLKILPDNGKPDDRTERRNVLELVEAQ